ncbi:MAG: hypothetical protein FRX48_02455 [Lasallia pustulata]|uniref:Uncharacterized protein n=1 Tax=Lasallia pustulata TaxID=136370 RepID=A0A5M8PWP5_9LECA|nr:MAG: hypothetical protein FRX48_02455 [Lasallia pustulata]
MLHRQLQTPPITAAQQVALPARPSPNRPHGMDHLVARQIERVGDFGVPGAAAMQGAAGGEQARAGGRVDGAVGAAAAEEGGVGRVDDGGDAEGGDGGADEGDSFVEGARGGEAGGRASAGFVDGRGKFFTGLTATQIHPFFCRLYESNPSDRISDIEQTPSCRGCTTDTGKPCTRQLAAMLGSTEKDAKSGGNAGRDEVDQAHQSGYIDRERSGKEDITLQVATLVRVLIKFETMVLINSPLHRQKPPTFQLHNQYCH